MDTQTNKSGDKPRQKNPAVHVDIVSDVMCPWCYIGQKNLEAAVQALEGVDVIIRWRPYQLDPTLPAEGKDRATYLNEKFGGEARASEIYKRVAEAGRASGIDFQFGKIAVSPNTLDAHRLLHWAAGQGTDVQNALKRRLFELYFEEGANIGDAEVLQGAATSVGMDGTIVKDLLATDKDKDVVRGEIDQAVQMRIQGVPFFILEGKYGLSGAQPSEVLANAISDVAAEISTGSQDN